MNKFLISNIFFLQLKFYKNKKDKIKNAKKRIEKTEISISGLEKKNIHEKN